MQQYDNFVEERLEKRTKPVNGPLRKRQAACVCATTEGSEIFPDDPPQRLLVVFAALHCMPDKERGPAIFFQARKPANTTVIDLPSI